MSLADVRKLSANELATLTQVFNERINEQPELYELCTDEDFTKKLLDSIKIFKGDFEDSYNCEDCNQTFTDNEQLKLHQNTAICEIKKICESKILYKETSCKWCAKTFINNKFLERHTILQHGVGKNERKGSNTCKVCYEDFKNESMLQRHLKNIHILKNDFKCSFCGLKCSNIDDFTDHKTTCDAATAIDITEQYNNSSHTNKSNGYQDEYHSFTKQLSMYSKKKYFVCKYCNMEFYLASSLIDHSRKHRTTRASSLVPDEVKKSGHECPICHSPFSLYASLKRHIRSNHFREKNDIDEEPNHEGETTDLTSNDGGIVIIDD